MTDLAPLPNGWSNCPFASFLTPINRSFSVDDEEEYRLCGVRWYGNGAFIRETKPGKEIKIKGKHLIKEGDVIYNKLFGWKGSFAIVQSELDECCVSDEFPIFRLDSSIVLPEFLGYFFQTDKIRELSTEQSRGVSAASRFRLHERDFLKLQIPLPLLEDQRRIVIKLRSHEKIIQHTRILQEEALQEAELVISATARNLVDPLKVDPVPLGCLGDPKENAIQTGPFGAQLGSDDFIDSGVPLISIGNVQPSGLKTDRLKYVSTEKAIKLDRFRVREGD